TRREQTQFAEENSPVDYFRRRGQGAKRREGNGSCRKKSLALRQKIKSVAKAMLFIFFDLLQGIRTRRERARADKKNMHF
ncbi:MAG: hypothetical protein PUE34_03270, partial [Clostridiaceae bacterium]|nr:hypothetical protein [Clostridiaceae bacterium]